MPVLGFRFGDIAYITDMSSIPESEFEKLKGLKHLTLNTVSYNRHHSHFSLEETLELADRIQAEHTWLTHLSHSFPTRRSSDLLEETLELADRFQAEHTWLTHLSHSFPVHEEFCQELNRLCSEKNVRSIVQPAYDGLVIE